MKVLLVTSWKTNCGIAAHSANLKAAVEATDPGIEMIPSAEALDPGYYLDPAYMHVGGAPFPFDLIHLNHHDALHARWAPAHVWQLKGKIPVVITYHDTRSGGPGAENSEKLKAFAQVAASTIVHEPTADVQAVYWRQGVPPAALHPACYSGVPGYAAWFDGTGLLHAEAWKASPQQPVLGTIGFNFPWKNYDRLCQLTAEEGWALVLLANDATEADEARWRAVNASMLVIRSFIPPGVVTNYLAGCDATVFMYECQNNGTSAAIREGIAARKPVIAHQGCRQFRDLYTNPLGFEAIQWVGDWEELRETLRRIPSTAIDPMIYALAEQDSWAKLGAQHARLYRMLVGVVGSTV